MARSKKKAATFYSKSPNQLLWLEPARFPVDDPSGRRLDPGTEGKSVEFENGTYTTEDEDTIKALREHRLFNSAFYEHGNAPDEPKPTVKEQLSKVTKAASDKDAEAVREVIAKERETHNREVVLDAAEDVLEAIESASAVEKAQAPEPADKPEEKASSTSRPSKES